MAMNGDQLGDEIAQALLKVIAQQTFHGTTIQVKAFGKGIVEEVKNGKATWGNTPSGHKISGISGDNMANLVMTYAGYPHVTDRLRKTCTAVADHVMQSAIVTYVAPPPSPPVIMPPDAWWIGGTISGLVGATLASMIVSYCAYGNVSTPLLMESEVIVKHIMSNALVTKGVIV